MYTLRSMSQRQSLRSACLCQPTHRQSLKNHTVELSCVTHCHIECDIVYVLGVGCSVTQSTTSVRHSSMLSSDTIRTVVMAKKAIAKKLIKEYCEHWEKRMELIGKQIGELVEEGFHEDIPIKMTDKKLYFVLREYWQEFTEIWWPAPSTDFTSTEDKKYTIMKALLDRSTGRTVSHVPVGKFAIKMAMMKATSLYKWEEKINKKLKGWADVMTGWLTLQERGQWLMEYFEQGKIPIGNWYDELHFDFY